jgi:hypothetical protein
MALMAPELAVALLAVLLLLVLMRLLHGRGERNRDYGLLNEVATVTSRRSARVVTDRLAECGIHATTVPQREAEGFGILVFPEDAPRAESILLESWSA